MLGRLAWRWPISVAAAIFVAANIVGAYVALRGESAVTRALEERAAAVARGVERRCHREIVAGDAAGTKRCLAGLWEEPGVFRVAVLETEGAVLAEARPRARSAQSLVVRYGSADERGEVRAFVVVEVDERAAERATADARREALVAAVAFSLVGVALSVLATRRVVRPLRRLAAAEAAIAAGDLGARAPVEGPEETRALASAFNEMAEAVRERDESLARRRDELQEALDRARALETEKRALTAMIVHDLRDPIGAARSALDVVETGVLPPVDREILAASAQRLDAALSMVGDLLDVSRLEQAERPLARAPSDLAALCRRLALAPWADGEGRPARVLLEGAAEPVTAPVDARLVERAVANLIGNAVRHAGGAGPVLVQVERAGAQARIVVEDQGPGVPAAERERVFRPFERGSHSRAAGAGLGLALCQRVASAHGGRIWVEDGPGGRGARFVLELPLEAE